MKKLTSLFVLFLSLVSYAQTSAPTQDLVFVASFDQYSEWYNKAFKADAMRRSNYCNEPKTLTAKIDNKGALIRLKDFDMAQMPAFAGDAEMGKLMKEYNISHPEVYALNPVGPEVMDQKKVDLFFIISSTDYDLWLKNAFSPDSKRRAQFCDESRTKVAKIDDHHAMVILYDFDMTRIYDFESDENAATLIKKYKVTHDVSYLTSI